MAIPILLLVIFIANMHVSNQRPDVSHLPRLNLTSNYSVDTVNSTLHGMGGVTTTVTSRQSGETTAFTSSSEERNSTSTTIASTIPNLNDTSTAETAEVITPDYVFNVTCDNSSISLHTAKPLEDYIRNFNHFISDKGIKMVSFQLVMPEYEGIDALLYNSTDTGIYGMWSWRWTYDQYGKTLLLLPPSAYYFSLGLLFLRAEKMKIYFTGKTNSTEIALMSTDCKRDIAVNFLITLVTSASASKDRNCLCHRYVAQLGSVSSACCCIDGVDELKNMTRQCERLQQPIWLYTTYGTLIFLVVAVSFTMLPYVSWSLLTSRSKIMHRFEFDNGEYSENISKEIDKSHDSLIGRDKTPISLTNFIKYWRVKTKPSSEGDTTTIFTYIKWLLFYWFIVPCCIWIYFLIALYSFNLSTSKKKEERAWRHFNGTDPQYFEFVLLPKNPIVMVCILGIYIPVLLIFVCSISKALLFAVKCILHPNYNCREYQESEKQNEKVKKCVICHQHTKENQKNNENSAVTRQVVDSQKDEIETDNAPYLCRIHRIYEKFLLTFESTNGDRHILVDPVDLGRNIQIFCFKEIFDCPKRQLRLCVVLLFLPPLLLIYFLGLYYCKVVYKSLKMCFFLIHNDSWRSWACFIVCTVVCIGVVLFFSLCVIVEAVAFIVAGITLNFDIIGPYLTVICVILTYVFSIYKEFTHYYEYLKDVTFEVVDSLQSDSEGANLQIFAKYRSDVLDERSTSENMSESPPQSENKSKTSQQKDEKSKTLLFQNVPFIKTWTWQDCITRESFSYICEKIYPVRLTFMIAILKFSMMSFLLMFVFFVIRSFDNDPYITALLTASVGIIPTLYRLIQAPKKADYDKTSTQLRKEIRVILLKVTKETPRDKTADGAKKETINMQCLPSQENAKGNENNELPELPESEDKV